MESSHPVGIETRISEIRDDCILGVPMPPWATRSVDNSSGRYLPEPVAA